ncbi:MAG: ATP-binding protein [Acidobacteria bacterium]|nr:ATP-binding protein [Acidobacteriota bacterium]
MGYRSCLGIMRLAKKYTSERVEAAAARADGSLRNLLHRLARIDVLIVDDWAMAPLSDTERRDFLEICDDHYQTRSTILIQMQGESMRKKRPGKEGQ